jgi:transposase
VRLTGLARNTVRSYLARGLQQEGSPPLKNGAELAAVVYNQDTLAIKSPRYQDLLKHFDGIDKELVKTGVTRLLLWREYIDSNPDGYGYSQYCFYLQQVLANKDVSMHLEYAPADQLMIDFAGKKFYYVDKGTGEYIPCEVFVATLPYSG